MQVECGSLDLIGRNRSQATVDDHEQSFLHDRRGRDRRIHPDDRQRLDHLSGGTRRTT
jgi:hypothetical protein